MNVDHEWLPLTTRHGTISITDRCSRCHARLKLAPAGRARAHGSVDLIGLRDYEKETGNEAMVLGESDKEIALGAQKDEPEDPDLARAPILEEAGHRHRG